MAMDVSTVPPKVCAACGGRYPVDALFCPTDGTPLQSATAAGQDAGDSYLGREISGHIEIRQLVGGGAMGRVYRAFQRGIDRDVAVKILHRELSANAQLVARFTREAKVASRLQHPNVVQVLLAGQLHDRALYMVMEYLDGLSLQDALAAAGGALPLDRALHIVLQLCEAVGEAHVQGIVHRDLKPENVMLVRRGSDPDFVKVLDFGIARINWGEQSVATAAGLIFGTARYISPEGAQGNVVGPASDVYSIGTLLFQMLSGRTPFDGDQAVGLLVQQIHDPAPELRSIPRAASVPEPIAEAVMASLAKDPAEREPDAHAFGQAILDAAKRSGLSPEEFSRPLHARRSSAMKLTPDVGQSPSTAATVKWEPPAEFQARFVEPSSNSTYLSNSTNSTNERPSRAHHRSSVDETIDDRMADAPQRQIARTVPGEVRAPARTQYTTPALDVTSAPPAVRPRPSSPESPAASEERRSFAWLLVVLCFMLGAALALGWAWRVGKIGSGASDEEERFVARATDAMFENRFHEPPGDNVKDITDEGLRRWPDDRRLLDVRVRAANELIAQALAQRSAGDVAEALRLAKIARDLDPHDTSATRLIAQYEAELADVGLPTAPTLAKPPERPPVPSAKPPSTDGSGPQPAPTPSAQRPRLDYKALLDVSVSAPRPGQTVELTARIAPSKGAFDAPGFTIAGPGVPGGVRVAAQSPSPGVFKASYAFLEPGRFEISFSAQESGKPISAKRAVTAVAPPPPPTPPPTPPPSPTGSVKWM